MHNSCTAALLVEQLWKRQKCDVFFQFCLCIGTAVGSGASRLKLLWSFLSPDTPLDIDLFIKTWGLAFSQPILFRSWFNDLMFCLEGESIQEDCYSKVVEFTTDLLCIPSILNIYVCACIYIYLYRKKVCSAYTATPWNITPEVKFYSNSRIFNYELHCHGCILHGMELTTDMLCFRISSLELFSALFFIILYKRNQAQSYTLSFSCQHMCKSRIHV